MRRAFSYCDLTFVTKSNIIFQCVFKTRYFHFQLLRSSLVNNFTQAIICDDLGMTEYLINGKNRVSSYLLKTKERADLLEC